MSIFSKNKPTLPPDPSLALAREVRMEMEDERNFWDECAIRILNEDDTVDRAATRSIEVADRLLEARRSRFPRGCV